MLPGRLGLPGRLRPELGADRLQGENARRERVPVALDDVVEFAEQGRGFIVGEVKIHSRPSGQNLTFGTLT